MYIYIYIYIYICAHTPGGAIYAEANSVVLLDSPTSLSGNTAADSGGALYIKGGAALSSKNTLLLEGNRAGAYGGKCVYTCTCTWMDVWRRVRFLSWLGMNCC
jgi:predicted outer membrane repeat protein